MARSVVGGVIGYHVCVWHSEVEKDKNKKGKKGVELNDQIELAMWPKSEL